MCINICVYTHTYIHICRLTSYRKVTTPHLCCKTNHLMPYREILSVYSKIHTIHTNALCGQNVELLSVKPVVPKPR